MNESKLFTYTFSNGVVRVEKEDGFLKLCISNLATSTTNCTFQGTGGLVNGGTYISSSAITLNPGESWTLEACEQALSGITITSPDANCTVVLTANS